MPVINLILIMGVCLLLFSICRHLRDIENFQNATRRQHDIMEARLAVARVMPDGNGTFVLMTPVHCHGGLADGETRFIPIDDHRQTLTLHWVHPGGVRQQEYRLTDMTDGTIQARPITPSTDNQKQTVTA